ncbi:MAG: hypothetical protein H6558_08220 [Lewinellaceae bacterium]|nr:hypothetical protein [Lewinellaceae bacterium]
MDSVKIIHEAAMEFYDLSKRAKAKGDHAVWKEYMERAYILEKEAALTMPEQQNNFMWRYILLRSAGWLAFQCGFYQEAANLAELGLNGNPPAIEKGKLEDLLNSIRQKAEAPSSASKTVKENKISGFLASVDLIENKIHIRQLDTEEPILILVSEERIREIARLFIGDIVQIMVRENEEGVKYLENIKRAA